MVDRSGSGSSLINYVIGKNCFQVYSTATTQHVCRELLINNKLYLCTFIDLEIPHASDILFNEPLLKEQIVGQFNPHQRKCLEKLNLVIYVCRDGHFTVEDKNTLQVYMNILPQSISALVVTHCDFLDSAVRIEIVEGLKSDEVIKDIAASMGKGIYTVGFSDLTQLLHIKPAFMFVDRFKSSIQEEVSKLHGLIEKSSDSVNALQETPAAVSCSIM